MINLTAMLIILAIFSIFFGYITKDIFIGAGTDFFSDNSIFIHPTNEIFINTEFGVPSIFKLLPFIFTVVFINLSLIKLEFKFNIEQMLFSRIYLMQIYSFFNQRFLIELLYNRYISGLVLRLGGETSKIIDRGSIELIGPFGLEKSLINLSIKLSKLDTGVLTSYALYILIGFNTYILMPMLFGINMI
jgi:NADH-ubiquinone oxidoreductase chain 5